MTPQLTLSATRGCAEKIHGSLSKLLSSGNKRNSELNDLPKDLQSIPWNGLYAQDERYIEAGLIDEKWTPRCLDQWGGHCWCFTILSRRGGNVQRQIGDGNSWNGRTGRRTENGYPSELKVNKLTTKKPIDDKLYRMIELTFEDQLQPIVALCKIKEIRTKASASQKEDDFRITEEANMEIEQPQEDSLEQLQFPPDDVENMNHQNAIASNPTQENLAQQIAVVDGRNLNHGNVIATNPDEESLAQQNAVVDGGHLNNGNTIVTNPDEESLAQQFPLDGIMNLENVFPPNEGTTGSIGQEYHTSNYMEDLSILWKTKESFVLIDYVDPNTARMLRLHVQQAAIIVKNSGVVIPPQEEASGSSFDVMEFLNNDPA